MISSKYNSVREEENSESLYKDTTVSVKEYELLEITHNRLRWHRGVIAQHIQLYAASHKLRE